MKRPGLFVAHGCVELLLVTMIIATATSCYREDSFERTERERVASGSQKFQAGFKKAAASTNPVCCRRPFLNMGE
jgi:hypothetical protein